MLFCCEKTAKGTAATIQRLGGRYVASPTEVEMFSSCLSMPTLLTLCVKMRTSPSRQGAASFGSHDRKAMQQAATGSPTGTDNRTRNTKHCNRCERKRKCNAMHSDWLLVSGRRHLRPKRPKQESENAKRPSTGRTGLGSRQGVG